MNNTDKRKAQLRESQNAIRAKKRKEGRVNLSYQIKPEWRPEIMGVIKKLEKIND